MDRRNAWNQYDDAALLKVEEAAAGYKKYLDNELPTQTPILDNLNNHHDIEFAILLLVLSRFSFKYLTTDR